MFKSIKYILFLGLTICFGRPAWAQVKFNLSLLSDGQTYLVSMVPETTWSKPMNTVGSVQVVLQYQSGNYFMAGNIQSLVPGISWVDNAYLESPAAAPEFSFVSFVMHEKGVKNIMFQDGVETPLFTFANLGGDCVGNLELVENESELVKKVVDNDHLNITQNIAVLGARGNAYTGNLNSSVDCSQTITGLNQPQLVKNLRVFPVPASDVVRIFWENIGKSGGPDKLLVTDMLGRQLEMEKEILPNAAGQQYLQLDISHLPTGLYTGAFINAGGDRQPFRFVVAH